MKTADKVVFAQESESLIISLANVGLTALMDEATGFQRERAPDALRELLDRYLKKEYAIWAKRFPDDFYHEMFRLKKWDWKGMAINRPSIVGTYTRDIVYARITPGLLRELEVLNPKDGSGNRLSKHHQWLTDEIGHPVHRIGHCHCKDTIRKPDGKFAWAPVGGGIIDWVGQFRAFNRDGYHYAVSLETHWHGGVPPAGSTMSVSEASTRASMQGLKETLAKAGFSR